jgi:hypothetical protein
VKEKITRRTSLKAIAASAVAGGAWLTNLAVPELIHASTAGAAPARGSTVGALNGADLKAAVDAFLSSSSGKALSGQVSALGHTLQAELASGGWFVIRGQRRVSVHIPYAAGAVAGTGVDIGNAEQAGASRLEQLGPDLFKVTSYVASNGAANRTHVFIADRAHRRLDIHDIATGKTRSVTHEDVQRTVDALQAKQAAPALSGLLGPTVVSADACGVCVFLVGAMAAAGMCAGAAWLACFVLIWDPPAAGACAAIVGVFGGWVLGFLCWALGLGFGATYGCYEIGYCSCPVPWGC